MLDCEVRGLRRSRGENPRDHIIENDHATHALIRLLVELSRGQRQASVPKPNVRHRLAVKLCGINSVPDAHRRAFRRTVACSLSGSGFGSLVASSAFAATDIAQLANPIFTPP